MQASGEELPQPAPAPRAPLGPSRAENCVEIGNAGKQACSAAAPTAVARTPPRQRPSPLRPYQSLVDADDDVCTPSPNVTVRARRKRRRRKALGSAEKTFDDANPASPPTSPSASVPPASPRSLPSTPTIKSPPTAAPRGTPGDTDLAQWLVASATSALGVALQRRSSGRWQHRQVVQVFRARIQGQIAAVSCFIFWC